MHQSSSQNGFTLVELLVGITIGLITTMVAGQVMLNQMESTRKIKNMQQQRDDWMHANNFLTSEINFAERITTEALAADISNCQTNNPDNPDEITSAIPDGSIKMVIHFPRHRQLPPSIYFVQANQAGWNNNLLKRCGPSIDGNGRYRRDLSRNDVIIDGLSDLEDGFIVNIRDNKLANFNINLVGLLNNAYKQNDGARARVQDVYLRPSRLDGCGPRQPELSLSVVRQRCAGQRADH